MNKIANQLAWLLVAFVLLVVCIAARAQTAILLPPPKIQFLDVNAKPLSGGFVFTYIAGTSINQATFTDSTGSVSNTNPIVLDAGGFPSSPIGPGQAAGIYLTNGAAYRICVQNSSLVQQYCADNVRFLTNNGPGGLNTQVQYNCAGSFCGNAGFTFNAGTQTLSVVGLVVSSGGSLSGTFAGNPTFSGTVTVSGSLVVSGTFTIASLASSTCGTPASTGFIRMCRADAVNWRNNANSADEGLSTDVNDRLNVSHAGGLLLNGTVADVFFGGTTNAFPRWHQVGTALQAKLADLSGDAPVTASTLTFNGAASGVVISGACATGQVLTATSPTAVSCQAQGAAILLHTNQTTLTNTAIDNCATGCQTVFTKAVTMPATGCPCRAFVTWFMYLSTTNSGADAAYVSDATNSWAAAMSGTPGSATTGFGAFGGSGSSPVTYSNGAVITFSVKMASSHAGGTTVSATPTGTAITGAPASQMVIDVFGSN